jgi:hypothetical protein
VLSAAGLALLAGIEADGSYLSDVLPGMLVLPLGAGAGTVAGTIAGVDGVDPDEAGLASGLINATRQMGSAIGLAALVSLALSQTLDLVAQGTDPVVAATRGYALTFAAAAVVMAAGGLIALVGMGSVRAARATAVSMDTT